MLRIEIRRNVHFIDLRERQVSTCRNPRRRRKRRRCDRQCKTIRTIPLVLHGNNYPEHFEIRGEILMPWEVFEELNREKKHVKNRFLPIHVTPRPEL